MRRLLIAFALIALPLLGHAKEVLPFIDNDYTIAISRAKTNNVPLFVEAWAPW